MYRYNQVSDAWTVEGLFDSCAAQVLEAEAMEAEAKKVAAEAKAAAIAAAGGGGVE